MNVDALLDTNQLLWMFLGDRRAERVRAVLADRSSTVTVTAFWPMATLDGAMTWVSSGSPVQHSTAGSPIRLFQCDQMTTWL